MQEKHRQQLTLIPHRDTYLDAIRYRDEQLKKNKMHIEEHKRKIAVLKKKIEQHKKQIANHKEQIQNHKNLDFDSISTYPKGIRQVLEQASARDLNGSMNRNCQITWHQRIVANRSRIEEERILFSDAQANDFLLLAVTLDTTVTDEATAESEMFQRLWNKHFLEKVDEHLPKNRGKHLYHHTYTIELSDGTQKNKEVPASFWQKGFWHFHGILAIRPDVARYIWKDNALNKALARDLRSFRTQGKYRLCSVPSFYLSPVGNLESWLRYIHKRRQSKITKYRC